MSPTTAEFLLFANREPAFFKLADGFLFELREDFRWDALTGSMKLFITGLAILAEVLLFLALM